MQNQKFLFDKNLLCLVINLKRKFILIIFKVEVLLEIYAFYERAVSSQYKKLHISIRISNFYLAQNRLSCFVSYANVELSLPSVSRFTDQFFLKYPRFWSAATLNLTYSIIYLVPVT